MNGIDPRLNSSNNSVMNSSANIPHPPHLYIQEDYRNIKKVNGGLSVTATTLTPAVRATEQ